MFSYILFYKKNYLKIILFSVFISLITYSFSYGDSNILSSEEIVEDAKGVQTTDFVIKKKLMKAIYNINIKISKKK